MARIRTIKPEFFTSEDVVALKPLTRLLFIALWCEADREGRMEWRPGTMRLRYFPGDDVDIDAMAGEMTARNMLVIYEIDEKRYAELPAFPRHQIVNNREATSRIPPRVDNATPTREHATPTREHATPTREHATATPLVGREGKEGKEHASRRDTSVDDERFADFWQAYPKKKAKSEAQKAWTKLKPDDRLSALIIEAVRRDTLSPQWQKDRGEFIPHPATYLNARRFDDVPAVHLPAAQMAKRQVSL
jgi:hypothetical protein